MREYVLGFICLLALGGSAGFLLFCFNRSIIVFRWPHNSYQDEHENTTHHKTIACSYWKDRKLITEQRVVLWYTTPTKNLVVVVNEWLSLAQSEHVVDPDVLFQDGAFGLKKGDVLLSFSQKLFYEGASTEEKLQIVFSLFKTLKDSGILVLAAMLLTSHQPMQDDHLDFSFPWLIDGYVRV